MSNGSTVNARQGARRCFFRFMGEWADGGFVLGKVRYDINPKSWWVKM